MFVLVVGGGKVGYYLTKELIESGHEVVLMEKDRDRSNQITPSATCASWASRSSSSRR